MRMKIGAVRNFIRGKNISTANIRFSSSTAVAKDMLWLLELLTKSSESKSVETHLSLSFFQQTVLPLARFYDSQAGQSTTKLLIQKRTVTALWGLFPSFCRHPTDLESVFPALAPLLVRAMNDERYPELIVRKKVLKTRATFPISNF